MTILKANGSSGTLRFVTARWRLLLITAGLAFCQALVIVGNHSAPLGLVLETLVVLLGVPAVRRPTMWLIPVFLTLLLLFDSGLTSSVSIFVLFLAVLDLLGNGYSRWGWTVVVAAHFAFVASLLSGSGLPVGLYLILSFFIMCAACSGSLVHSKSLRLEADRLRHHAQHRDERLQLSRSMHDTLASSMSHIVLLGRSLELDDLPIDSHQKAVLVREEAQKGLVELRKLLKALRESRQFHLPDAGYGSIESEWKQSLAALRAHDYEVADGFEMENDITDPRTLELLRIGIREITANVLRHGDPGRPVKLEFLTTRTEARILSSNATVRPGERPVIPSSGYGLQGLNERLVEFNGRVSTVLVDSHWITSIHFSLVEQGSLR